MTRQIKIDGITYQAESTGTHNANGYPMFTLTLIGKRGKPVSKFRAAALRHDGSWALSAWCCSAMINLTSDNVSSASFLAFNGGDTYKYKLSNMGAGSQKYGHCGVCHKAVSTSFLLRGVRAYELGWTYHKAPPTIFGHMDCLLSACRRDGVIRLLEVSVLESMPRVGVVDDMVGAVGVVDAVRKPGKLDSAQAKLVALQRELEELQG